MSKNILKKCTSCKKKLPLSAFWKEKRGLYGVKSKCKQCHYKYRKKKKYIMQRKYKDGECVEISFCKKCNCLLPVRFPGKNVIRKFYNQKLWTGYDTRLCQVCEHKDRKKWEKINRKRLSRRNWKLCPVCGQVVNLFESRHEEFQPLYATYPCCSKECKNRLNYALDIGITGIAGCCKTAFNIYAPSRYEDYLEKNEKYTMALLAKEYVILKQARLKLLKNLQEN